MEIQSVYRVIDADLTDGETKITVNGNLLGTGVILGLHLPFDCDLSRYYLRESNSGNRRPSLYSGKLNLKKGWLDLWRSGGVTIKVSDIPSHSVATYKFTTRNTGTDSAQTYQKPMIENPERFTFPLVGQSEFVRVNINSDEPKPLCVTGIGYIGDYNNDAQDV